MKYSAQLVNSEALAQPVYSAYLKSAVTVMRLELPSISTNRLLVRLATKEDVPEIVRYFCENQVHLAPWYPRFPANFLTRDYWQEQVEKNLKEFECDRSLRLFIFKNTNPKQIIGNSNFNGFMRGAAQFCYLGCGLAETEQGQGYMSEALVVAIKYVFKDLNMHRVMANYIPHNQRSGNLLKS